MIQRTLTIHLKRAVHTAGTVVLEGPRGAGKTTLLRAEFPRMLYVSMQDARDRSSARTDPSIFAARLRGSAIVDDIHLAPELAHHLARLSCPRAVILASSRKLSLPVTTLRLFRPTLAELEGRQPTAVDMLGHFVPAQTGKVRSVNPWTSDIGLIERDVRDLVQFRDLDRFLGFCKTAAEASGRVLDVQMLARRADTSRTTAVRWLEILDVCFLSIRVQPCGVNFGRRTVRSPKLHFLESGLFESRVVSELYRNAAHTGRTADLRYWRDSNGLEIPLVYQPPCAPPMGIYIAESPSARDFQTLQRWMKLSGAHSAAMVSAQAVETKRGQVLRYCFDRL